MDYITVDVGHLPGVEVGDVATLVGQDGARTIGLEELASRAATIPYEVSCGLGRLPRLHSGGRELSIPAQDPAERRPAASPASQPGQASGARRS